jgi:hypothetical protein
VQKIYLLFLIPQIVLNESSREKNWRINYIEGELSGEEIYCNYNYITSGK